MECIMHILKIGHLNKKKIFDNVHLCKLAVFLTFDNLVSRVPRHLLEFANK